MASEKEQKREKSGNKENIHNTKANSFVRATKPLKKQPSSLREELLILQFAIETVFLQPLYNMNVYERVDALVGVA